MLKAFAVAAVAIAALDVGLVSAQSQPYAAFKDRSTKLLSLGSE
jgi:hypothetical protein